MNYCPFSEAKRDILFDTGGETLEPAQPQPQKDKEIRSKLDRQTVKEHYHDSSLFRSFVRSSGVRHHHHFITVVLVLIIPPTVRPSKQKKKNEKKQRTLQEKKSLSIEAIYPTSNALDPAVSWLEKYNSSSSSDINSSSSRCWGLRVK